MPAYSLASYARLLPGQLFSSGIPTETTFQVSLIWDVPQPILHVPKPILHVPPAYIACNVKLNLTQPQVELELGLSLAR